MLSKESRQSRSEGRVSSNQRFQQSVPKKEFKDEVNTPSENEGTGVNTFKIQKNKRQNKYLKNLVD